MDILKKDSFSLTFKTIIFVFTLVMMGQLPLADAKVATETLRAVYKLPVPVNEKEAKPMITNLKAALSDCSDEYLAFRIRYKIGIIQFQIHNLEASRTTFSEISDNSECPELIRLYSLNMAGQISRLLGNDYETLRVFSQLSDALKACIGKGIEKPVLFELQCSAFFGKAEIYWMQKDFSSSLAEYGELLHFLEQHKAIPSLRSHIPLVSDRISQLHLMQNSIDKYLKITTDLVRDYPAYYRTPIIKFERECVIFINDINKNVELFNGSYSVPAVVIRYLKEPKADAQKMATSWGELCSEYGDTYGAIVLQYHYAWLLEVVGRTDEAAKIFSHISSVDLANYDETSTSGQILDTIRKYARIQLAIMYSETGEYVKALKILGAGESHTNKSHLSELTSSVRESIESLKREVRVNEKE